MPPVCGGYVGKPLSASVYHIDITNKGPLKKKNTYASIADASYGAHIAHLHIVATLLGAGLDCFLHSEVSCAGNIPQRF